jgi:hypothetical protein
VPTDKGEETGRQAGLARLLPETGARRQAQEPAAADGGRAEPLPQDGRAGLRLPPHGDVGLDQQPVDLGRQRRLEVAAQGRTDDRMPPPVDGEVWSEERNRAWPPTEEGEDARLAVAGQAQEGWAHPRQQTLDLAIGDLHRLGLEPQLAGRRREPASGRLIAVP